MMPDINQFIDREMRSRHINNYKVVACSIDITKPEVIIDLNKYIYLFASTRVDTPVLPCRVKLASPDNMFQFTKTTLENSDIAQYQFFSEELTIQVENYGSNDPAQFLGFSLEFFKIIPEIENKEVK